MMNWNDFSIKFLCLLCMLFFHFVTFSGSRKDVPEWFSILSDSFYWTFLVMSAPTLYLLIYGGTWSLVSFIASVLAQVCLRAKQMSFLMEQVLCMMQVLVIWAAMLVL